MNWCSAAVSGDHLHGKVWRQRKWQSACRDYKKSVTSPHDPSSPNKRLIHHIISSSCSIPTPHCLTLPTELPTADIGNAGSPAMDTLQPTVTYQPPTQGPDPESGNQEKPRSIFSILAWVFLWISLVGFLVLPSSFPQIEKFLNESGELTKVVQFTQNVPLWVLFFPYRCSSNI